MDLADIKYRYSKGCWVTVARTHLGMVEIVLGGTIGLRERAMSEPSSSSGLIARHEFGLCAVSCGGACSIAQSVLLSMMKIVLVFSSEINLLAIKVNSSWSKMYRARPYDSAARRAIMAGWPSSCPAAALPGGAWDGRREG